MPTLESFGGPVAGTCRASRSGKRPDRPPADMRVVSDRGVYPGGDAAGERSGRCAAGMARARGVSRQHVQALVELLETEQRTENDSEAAGVIAARRFASAPAS